MLYNIDAGSVILAKQFRIATYVNGNSTGMLWETPASLLEEEELPEQAIIREIKETGYAIDSIEKAFEAYSSPVSLTELIHYYVAPYTVAQKAAKGGGLEEEGEELTIVKCHLKKLCKW